jgi:BirA family transcriptional regulator, biotin operon repressor / biotin---[acetyl-CoA-carboxylase] ligase
MASMNERPVFPPLFRPFAVTPELDPFERCLSVAADGAEPGTLLWSIGTEACECAIVLAPEQPLEPSLPIVLVAALGLADALGALLPPVVAVTFGWPDRIEVNGGVVGGVRLAGAETAAPETIPDWLVVGFGIAMRGTWPDDEPGHRLQRTTLADEGFGDVLTIDLLEAFSRHFLSWINRWQEDGMEPVVQAWLARATGLGKPIELEVGGRAYSGTFAGLTESGGMRLVKEGITHTIPLDEAMRVPTWAA